MIHFCPLCGLSSELKQIEHVVKYDFLDKNGDSVDQNFTVQSDFCTNCESIFERYEEARDVHDFHCKLLSRVTIDEINLLKSVIQKDEELAKYSTWNKIATVILGISENTIHAWRRFDGIPSLQTSQTVKQLLNHPNLIIERIQFYENPFSERRQQC